MKFSAMFWRENGKPFGVNFPFITVSENKFENNFLPKIIYFSEFDSIFSVSTPKYAAVHRLACALCIMFICALYWKNLAAGRFYMLRVDEIYEISNRFSHFCFQWIVVCAWLWIEYQSISSICTFRTSTIFGFVGRQNKKQDWWWWWLPDCTSSEWKIERDRAHETHQSRMMSITRGIEICRHIVLYMRGILLYDIFSAVGCYD